jgi:hypothetical protein
MELKPYNWPPGGEKHQANAESELETFDTYGLLRHSRHMLLSPRVFFSGAARVQKECIDA